MNVTGISSPPKLGFGILGCVWLKGAANSSQRLVGWSSSHSRKCLQKGGCLETEMERGLWGQGAVSFINGSPGICLMETEAAGICFHWHRGTSTWGDRQKDLGGVLSPQCYAFGDDRNRWMGLCNDTQAALRFQLPPSLRFCKHRVVRPGGYAKTREKSFLSWSMLQNNWRNF